MILYPTALQSSATRAIQRAAADLRPGCELNNERAVDMKTIEDIVDLSHWQKIEREFPVSN